MKHQVHAQVLTIYIGEDDKWGTGLLYPAIVERLLELGVAGVTVIHGSEGFGSHHKLHTARFESLFQALPMVIEAVDIPDRIALILSALDEMVAEGLITIQEVEAIRYSKEPTG